MNRIPGNKTNFISIMLPAVILMLLACTGHQLEVKPISKSENPQELINQLDNDIALAHKNQLNVLAPTWFGKADASLNEAKKGLESQCNPGSLQRMWILHRILSPKHASIFRWL